MGVYYGGENRRRAIPDFQFRGIERRDVNADRADREAENNGFTCPNCGFNAGEHKALVEKSTKAIGTRDAAANQVEAARVKAVEDTRQLNIKHAQDTTKIETERGAAAEKLRVANLEVARTSEEARTLLALADPTSGTDYDKQERNLYEKTRSPAYAEPERRGGAATVFPAYAGENRRRF